MFEPIYPSELYVLASDEEERVSALVAFFNERLQSAKPEQAMYSVHYRTLNGYVNGLNDRLISCAVQRFRERFWEIQESPGGEMGTLITFHLPENRERC